MFKGRIFAALLLAALAGCSDPLGLVGARAATPEEVRQAVAAYRITEECLGLTGAVDRVVWRIADSITWHGDEVGGFTRDDVIHLAYPENDFLRHRMTLHESMHHILWHATGNGDERHRDRRWSVCAQGTS